MLRGRQVSLCLPVCLRVYPACPTPLDPLTFSTSPLGSLCAWSGRRRNKPALNPPVPLSALDSSPSSFHLSLSLCLAFSFPAFSPFIRAPQLPARHQLVLRSRLTRQEGRPSSCPASRVWLYRLETLHLHPACSPFSRLILPASLFHKFLLPLALSSFSPVSSLQPTR